MGENVDPSIVQVGDRVRFDGKSTSWLVRASACGDRYLIATAAIFGEVHYTIIDRHKGVRGPLNVIGGGMGIETLSGPDEAIEETVGMLEGRWRDHPEGCICGAYACVAAASGSYEVSHRNRVSLRISTRVPA